MYCSVLLGLARVVDDLSGALVLVPVPIDVHRNIRRDVGDGFLCASCSCCLLPQATHTINQEAKDKNKSRGHDLTADNKKHQQEVPLARSVWIVGYYISSGLALGKAGAVG